MVAVARTSTRWPISRHGTEYNARSPLMWMSGPTSGLDQVASTNRVAGSLHVLDAGELPAPPEAVPHIRHRPFHPRLVLRPPGPRRIHQGAVVLRELGIRPVDLRVVQVRLVHPGAQVVRHQPGGHPSNMRVSLSSLAGKDAAGGGRVGAALPVRG